jgi:hypothetical protein
MWLLQRLRRMVVWATVMATATVFEAHYAVMQTRSHQGLANTSPVVAHE